MKTALAYIAFALAIACMVGFAGMAILIAILWRQGQPGIWISTFGWVLTAILPLAAIGLLTLGLSLLNNSDRK